MCVRHAGHTGDAYVRVRIHARDIYVARCYGTHAVHSNQSNSGSADSERYRVVNSALNSSESPVGEFAITSRLNGPPGGPGVLTVFALSLLGQYWILSGRGNSEN